MLDHVLQAFLGRVQRHPQLVRLGFTEAAHDGTGSLPLDGAAAPSHPLEVRVQGFPGRIRRRGVRNRIEEVDDTCDGVRSAPGERPH